MRVPFSHRIGEEGRGWQYAMFLLQAERLSYAHVARKKKDLKQLRNWAAESHSGA
jgi:alkylation response protein AidB-like acyl-CoA dehydrogenase